jgi:hypothetical protein
MYPRIIHARGLVQLSRLSTVPSFIPRLEDYFLLLVGFPRRKGLLQSVRYVVVSHTTCEWLVTSWKLTHLFPNRLSFSSIEHWWLSRHPFEGCYLIPLRPGQVLFSFSDRFISHLEDFSSPFGSDPFFPVASGKLVHPASSWCFLSRGNELI